MKALRLIPGFVTMSIAAGIVFTSSCKKEECPDDITVPTDTLDTIPPISYNLEWPQWVFSHWVWEDESTQQSAQALVDDYLAHNIPVGAIIIDSPWETGYNTFEWDNNLFPDAQGMIDYMHSKNVRVFMWITGIINTDTQPLYDYAKSHGYFMKLTSVNNNPAVVNWWKGDGSLIDWWNPDAVAWWKGLMDKTLDMGIDGWKCDGTDYYAVLSSYSPAKGESVSRLEYSHAYYRVFHEYTREKLGKDRVLTARPIDNYDLQDAGGNTFAFSPIDITWAAWVGDQDATFDGLKAALNNMYWSSDYGYLSFGSDIGGYREDNNFPQGRGKEVFIRWAQLGAFCPIMENGGGGEHRPWMFDQETVDIYRKFVFLHDDLLHYFMKYSEKYFAEGRSLMEFESKMDYSYMLGPDIFVSPFLQSGTTITVTFPAGHDWVYLFDKTEEFVGGQTMTLSIPLDEYPIFLRKGSWTAGKLNPRTE